MKFLWILFIQGTNCLTLEEDYHIFWYRSVLQWSKIKANQKCTKMYGDNRHHENNFQFTVSKNLAQTSTWRTKSVTCLHPCSRDLETCLLSITEEDVIDNRHRYISQLEPGLINTITMPQSKDCAPFSWALNSPGKPPFLCVYSSGMLTEDDWFHLVESWLWNPRNLWHQCCSHCDMLEGHQIKK